VRRISRESPRLFVQEKTADECSARERPLSRSSGRHECHFTSCNTTGETSAVLDEEVWSAWLHKNRLREQATFRRLKIAAGIVLAAVAAGCVFVVFFVK
jgi:hypothetical protein